MRALPSFESTTRLVARSLGVEAAALAGALRRATEADFDSVLAFRATQFDEPPPGDDAAYLRWRYRFGRSDRGLGDLFLVEWGGQVAGVVGTEDLVVRHGTERHRALRSMDILVARSLRASGLGVWINQALFREAPVVVVVGANEQSAGTVRRLFDELPHLQAWILPIDIGWKLRERWGSGARAAAASAVGNRFLRLRRALGRPSGAGPWEIREIPRFDASVDPLFEPDGPANAVFERGADYLNYRLFANPRARYRAAGLYREGLLAGTVCWHRLTGSDGSSWKHIVDWRAAGARRAEGLGRLLAHVASEGERLGCDYVLVARQGSADAQVLRHAGFVGPRAGREVLVGLHAGDAGLRARLAGATWSFSELDDDVDGT